MSEQVRYQGSLTPIRQDLQLDEIANILYRDEDLPSYYKSKVELLKDDDDYFVRNDEVYKINKKQLQDENIYYAHQRYQLSDVIDFDVSFYNGGEDINEALDTAITKMLSPKD